MAGRMPGTRRERVRDATTAEIKRTARDLLVRKGIEALTLRAIAREMGMTAPALYRYFASREDLVAALIQDLHDELTAALRTARDAAPAGDPLARIGATCRGFRRWSLDHPREFQLSFATTVAHDDRRTDCSGSERLGFGGVFLDLFVELWEQQPFLVPTEAELGPELTAQLRTFGSFVDDVLPLGALAAYLIGWTRLYGAVTMEIFHHLDFALTDPEPVFDAMLAEMGRSLSQPPG